MQGKGSPFSQTTCHFYPVLYYTVQVVVLSFFYIFSCVSQLVLQNFLWQRKTTANTSQLYFSSACLKCISQLHILNCHLNCLQGASLFSLTVVTLNRAAMLFLPTMVEKVNIQIKIQLEDVKIQNGSK